MRGHLLEKCRRKLQIDNANGLQEDNVRKDQQQKGNTWIEKQNAGDFQIGTNINKASSSVVKKHGEKASSSLQQQRIQVDRENATERNLQQQKIVEMQVEASMHISSGNSKDISAPSNFQEVVSSSGEEKLIMSRKLQKWKKVFKSSESGLKGVSNGLGDGFAKQVRIFSEQQHMSNQQMVNWRSTGSKVGSHEVEERLILAAQVAANRDDLVPDSDKEIQLQILIQNSGNKSMSSTSGTKQDHWMTGRDSVSLNDESNVNEELLYAAQEAANRDDSGSETDDFDVGKQRSGEPNSDSDRYVSDPETSSAHRPSMMDRIPRKYRDGLKDISDLF